MIEKRLCEGGDLNPYGSNPASTSRQRGSGPGEQFRVDGSCKLASSSQEKTRKDAYRGAAPQ